MLLHVLYKFWSIYNETEGLTRPCACLSECAVFRCGTTWILRKPKHTKLRKFLLILDAAFWLSCKSVLLSLSLCLSLALFCSRWWSLCFRWDVSVVSLLARMCVCVCVLGRLSCFAALRTPCPGTETDKTQWGCPELSQSESARPARRCNEAFRCTSSDCVDDTNKMLLCIKIF